MEATGTELAGAGEAGIARERKGCFVSIGCLALSRGQHACKEELEGRSSCDGNCWSLHVHVLLSLLGASNDSSLMRSL